MRPSWPPVREGKNVRYLLSSLHTSTIKIQLPHSLNRSWQEAQQRPCGIPFGDRSQQLHPLPGSNSCIWYPTLLVLVMTAVQATAYRTSHSTASTGPALQCDLQFSWRSSLQACLSNPIRNFEI